MKLLLLNTCGAEGSVALADTEFAEPIAALKTMSGRTASERLVATLRETMSETGWQLRELSAIAVVTGPGSFTGVRVGLSVAKGLSEASGVPLIAVSRLAMLAEAGVASGSVCALIDAGRGEFYCGYSTESTEWNEALLSKDDAVVVASKANAVVICEESVEKAFADLIDLGVVAEPTAADALPIALKRLFGESFDDPKTLDANYLRRTDAEIFAPKSGAKLPVQEQVGP